jgi:hypothetical protein
MGSITIPLPDDVLKRLEELARDGKVTPEELVRSRLEEWLREPADDFLRAARYVLDKNAELYRRLS